MGALALPRLPGEILLNVLSSFQVRLSRVGGAGGLIGLGRAVVGQCGATRRPHRPIRRIYLNPTDRLIELSCVG